MWSVSSKRYGRYELFISPPGASNTLIALKNNQSIPLKTGRNILPIGIYRLVIEKKGFVSLETNFFLTARGLSHQFILQKKPITLIIESQKYPVDVYLDNELIIPNYLNPTITISNIPAGMHTLGLFQSNELFFYKSFHSREGTEVKLKGNSFYHYQRTLTLAGILGLVPGLNYFIHFPQSTIGFVIPNLVLHYLFLTSYILQSSGVNLFNDATNPSSSDSYKENLRDGLIMGIIFSSLLHSVFSFLGTKNDLDDILKSHRIKLTWGIKMNSSDPLYGLQLHYSTK